MKDQNHQINRKEKLGVALVGLGKYSTEQLAPALLKTTLCRLAAIVTGSPEKAEMYKHEYKLSDDHIYNYENFDSIRNDDEVDIVYVVLPNAMHAWFTIRAANAGKHVICEKPMATTVEDCKQMINACKEANRFLAIGYRLHSEPFNQNMMDLGQNKKYGEVKTITAKNGFTIEPGVWRVEKKLAGGGPLMDVGIYCIQGALYIMGENPIAVTAQEDEKTDNEKFEEVEQSITFQLYFANGAIAHCETSYAKEMDMLRADAERGWFELKPAYAYRGLKGKTSEGKMNLPEINQQAVQMDDFAKCILENKPCKVPGEMGLRDVKIMMAAYEAARTGKKVELNWQRASVEV